MAGISVGSVSVDIVPDTTNFRRELNAKLKDLSVPVRLDLNDKAFDAQLAEATRPRDVNVHVDDNGSINRMRGRTHNLITALALLAPAAAPLTAVAIGGTVALGGLGAAGILAFKGIQAEMKAGTVTGTAYTSLLGQMKTNLSTLERTAATGVLTGFTAATGELSAQMPFLNREIAFLSQSIGSDLAPVTSGILGLFKDLSPSTHSIADGIHNLAVGFEGWANGPGGRAFADYLAHQLPIVVATLRSLGEAGAHLVQALLPLGGPVLGAIKGISDGISHIPVQVIRTLFLAFAGYKAITLTASAIDAVTAATKRLQVTQATGGKGRAAGLIGAGGPIGAALAGIALTTDAVHSEANREQNIRVKKLASDPAALAAAQQRLTTLQGQEAGATGARGPVGFGSRLLKDDIAAALKLKAANDALTGSTRGTTVAVAAEAAAVAALGKKMDDAFDKSAGLKSAQIGVAQAAADATAAVKENGRTLNLHTQAGRDNRTALLNLATAEHTKIDADIAAGKPQKDITADIKDGHRQLQTMAEKFGLSRAAAKRYADSLLAIPKNVLTTVTVHGVAKSAAQIAALKQQLGTGAFYAGQKGDNPHTGGYIHRQGGGPVWGEGTANSDSIPAFLSNGEFVIKAATVKAVGAPFLHKLNDTGMAAGSGMAPIYVQNPFTGEYLLAQVDARTSSAMRAEGRRVSAGRR